MTAKQTNLFEVSGEVCKVCKCFSKVENRFYCHFFTAFLSEETLDEPCDFLEVKK